MSVNRRLIPLLLLVACGNGGAERPDRRRVLSPFYLHAQESEEWCWAACGQMVMHYLGHNVSQCTQTDRFLSWFGVDGGCSCTRCLENGEPLEDLCRVGGITDFRHFGFRKRGGFWTHPLHFESIARELDGAPESGAPVIFVWVQRPFWWPINQHMGVIFGYRVVNGEKWLLIADPNRNYDCGTFFGQWISWEAYVGNSKQTIGYNIYGVRWENG